MRALAIPSRIEHVTIYAFGARVRRVATVAADGEPPDLLRFTDLPLALIAGSVRAEVVGPAVATTLRVALDVPRTTTHAGEEPEDVLAARRRVALTATELARLEATLAALERQGVVVEDPSDDPPAPWPAVIAARQTLVELRGRAELELRRQVAAARGDNAEARRALDRAVERAALTSSSRAPRVHELRRVVEVELARSGSAVGELRVAIEYRVAAARWTPSYVARIDGAQARVEIRAAVAQRTGEDWTGVALALSTAQPDQFAPLPELSPLKIGRRQRTPAKLGFRAPPAGVEALFVDYDRSAPGGAKGDAGGPRGALEASLDARDITARVPKRAITDVVWDEESSRAKQAFHTPPQGAPAFGSTVAAPPLSMPPPAARPMSVPMPRSAPAPKKLARTVAARSGVAKDEKSHERIEPETTRSAPRGGGGGDGSALSDAFDLAEAAASPASEGELVPRLDYTALRMASADSATRGQLVPTRASVFEVAADDAVEADVARLAGLPLPAGCRVGWADGYDYAFVADGTVDVPSDGGWHALAITAKPSTVAVRHVAVPREQPDVFRLATIVNPHDAPLLPGPIDIYDGGAFLITSHVELTPPGASVDVGLGVDAMVKIARNATFHEEATGMLRGALRLVHAVTVEVDNRSARALELEVRERIPVVKDGDDTVEVAVTQVEPTWESWAPDPDAPADQRVRGGKRWRVKVAAGGKTKLRSVYEVKLSSKLELVGGNRREP
jgi:hypothetical protein